MGMKLIAAARRARAKAGYEQSLRDHQRREAKRERMYDTLDYALGKDTDGARRAALALARVAESKAGPQPPSKAQRKASAKRSRKEKPETARIEDADKITRTVEVTGRFIRGLEPHQKRAMERFDQDWALATRPLRSPGFEPKVDGGGAQREPIAMIEAQKRLSGLRAHLGERDWSCLLAIAVGRAGASELHRRGGPQHAVNSYEIGRIMDATSAYYGMGGARKDSFLAACVSVVKEMEKSVG